MVPMDTAERNLGGQQTRHIKHSINFTSNDIDRNSNNRETENYYLLSYHLSQHNVAMRLHRSILVAALAVATNLVQAAQLTFTIPTSPLLTNPSTLPPSTRATLYKHNNSLSVPLSRRNTFEFSDVSPGSWLFTVQCRDYAFGPLRVDVETTIGGDGDAEARREKVEVHQTFWGNEWRNKGERRGGAVAEPGAQARCIVEVKAERAKDYYMERAGCAYHSHSHRNLTCSPILSELC